MTSPTSATTRRAMKAPTPGIRVRTETRGSLCAHAWISRFTGRELALEVGDEGEQALEPAAGRLGQRELAQEAPTTRGRPVSGRANRERGRRLPGSLSATSSKACPWRFEINPEIHPAWIRAGTARKSTPESRRTTSSR